MGIRETVKRTVKKYHTSNPYELAKAMNIIVMKKPLGSINGFYYRCYRQKFIFLNDELEESKELFTLAHEIGHSVIHPSTSTPFFKSNTLFSVDKLEIEANQFAAELLIPDEMLYEFQEYTVDQVASLCGYSKEVIELRIK